MKHRTKKVLSAALAVFMLACVFSSCSLTGNALKFKENDSGYALYRYKSKSTQSVFNVPETYENKPVTELLDFSIANAEYVKEVNIGAAVEKINVWAFSNCPLLEKINVSPDNKNYISVDGVLYNKDMTELIVYPNGKTPLATDKDGAVTGGAEFTVPDTVKKIGDNAFYQCSNLYSITFNEGLEEVGNKAFLKCGNLIAIELPGTLTTIGDDAFSYCNAVKKLEIPSNVKKIGNYAFFSTASKIDKIVIHQNSADDLELGGDWIPHKENSVREKVAVEYAGSK